MRLASLFMGDAKDSGAEIRRIAVNTGWLFFDRVLRIGAGLFVTAWVARYLGPSLFGTLNYAFAYVALFSAFASVGLEGILVRELVNKRVDENEILGSAFVLRLGGAFLAFAFSAVSIVWVRPGDSITHHLVAILAAGTVFQPFEVITYWFQYRVLSKYVVLAKGIALVMVAFTKIGFILAHAPLVFFAWAGFGEAVLGALGLILVYRSQGHAPQKWRATIRSSMNMIKDSWPVILGGISVAVYMRIDRIILGEMIGSDAVGDYSAATLLSEACYFVPTIIVSSVFPSIVQARKQSIEVYYQKLGQLFRLMTLLAIGISIPTAIFARPLVGFLFSKQFSSAAPVLAVHIWASLFVFWGVAQSTWDLAENLTGLAFLRASAGAFVNVTLNVALIPAYGVIGTALVTVISYMVSAFLLNAFHPRTRPIFFAMFRSLIPSRYFVGQR